MNRLSNLAFVVFTLVTPSVMAASLDMQTSLDVFDNGGLASRRYIQYANDQGYIVDGVRTPFCKMGTALAGADFPGPRMT